MQQGIRDAVITLSVQVTGLFRVFDCQGRGRRLQAIRRWRVDYILVVFLDQARRNDAFKAPTHLRACPDHAVLGLGMLSEATI